MPTRASERNFSINDFEDWNPKIMRFDATMIAMAPTGAGKTTFILDCLHKGNTRRTMIICTSPECTKTYAKHVPTLYCHDVLDKRLIAQLEEIQKFQGLLDTEATSEGEARCEIQEMRARKIEEKERKEMVAELRKRAVEERWNKRKMMQEGEKALKEHRKRHAFLSEQRKIKYAQLKDRLRERHSWTIVWDDLANQDGALDLPIIEGSVKAGRHYIMKQFFACQDIKDFKCKNRGQIFWVALAPIGIGQSRIKAFVEDWLVGSAIGPAEFGRLLRLFCEHDKWMIINRRAKSMDPTKMIFKYKATYYEPYEIKRKVGSDVSQYVNDIFFDPQRMADRQTGGAGSKADDLPVPVSTKGTKRVQKREPDPSTTGATAKEILREKERRERQVEKDKQKRATMLEMIDRIDHPRLQDRRRPKRRGGTSRPTASRRKAVPEDDHEL